MKYPASVAIRVIMCATLCALATSAVAATGDITLVGTQTIPNSQFVTDVWGYYDANTQTEYAIVGDNLRAELHIFDVTSPPLITPVAVVPGVAAFDMKVFGHYIYACDGDQLGIDTRIIDIADPANPVVLARVLNSTHNLAVSPSGLLFMESPGLRIFDLANPEHPILFWSSPGAQGHDCTPVGTRLFDFHGTTGTRIWDIAAPNAPVELGIIQGGITYHHSGDVTADGDYVVVCDELSNHPSPDFTVWDIRNPALPVRVGEWGDSNATIHNLYVEGTLAYASYYSAGFRVFDISDPAQPVLLDEFDTSITSGEGFMGAFGVYTGAPSGRVYVSDWDNGLFVFEVEQPVTTPVSFTAFAARAEPGAVVLTWDVFADEAFSGFRVYRSVSDGPAIDMALLGAAARRWRDPSATGTERYRYTVAAVHLDGTEVRSRTVAVTPSQHTSRLHQNHPNPFNPSTTISFELARAGSVRLEIFGPRGRVVRTLVEEERPAGPAAVTWDGTDRYGRAVSSGLYFYRLVVSGETLTRRMVLLK